MKQLIVLADMEGASGIFEHNKEAMYHGENLWRTYGKKCLTSDLLAVCEGAKEAGIDQILIGDLHFAGMREHNFNLEQLPSYAKVFDLPNRGTYMRRIQGQAESAPFGLITVGQHARQGTANAYFAHTIQSPPIESFYLNNKHIAEIGLFAYSFCGTPYIANIGCSTSHQEALEICETVSTITVKNKATSWEPTFEETFPLIKQQVYESVTAISSKKKINIDPPYSFSLNLMPNFKFDDSKEVAWKGSIHKRTAEWTAPSVDIGLEIFQYVRGFIQPT